MPLSPVAPYLSLPALRRTDVEIYYFTNAMSFFVGWEWIIVCRDISTLITQAAESVAPATAIFSFRLASNTICLVVFGPVLAYLLLLRGGKDWSGLGVHDTLSRSSCHSDKMSNTTVFALDIDRGEIALAEDETEMNNVVCCVHSRARAT